MSTPTCSGRCGAAAATSAWSPRSSSASTPSGPPSWPGPSSGTRPTPGRLRFYRDFVRDAPDELGTVVRFGAAPPLPVIPEDLHWRPVVMVGTCYAGPMEDG